MAARWKQWRFYFKDMPLTGTGQQMLGGIYASSNSMYFSKVYNIEMDPHEDLNLGGVALFIVGPVYQAIEAYQQSVMNYPNPPSAYDTNFRGNVAD